MCLQHFFKGGGGEERKGTYRIFLINYYYFFNNYQKIHKLVFQAQNTRIAQGIRNPKIFVVITAIDVISQNAHMVRIALNKNTV